MMCNKTIIYLVAPCTYYYLNSFLGIIPREKQEIKTVRIVKRESERRQRDRDRSGNIGLPLTNTAVAKRVSVVDELEEEEAMDSPDTQVSIILY